MLFAFEAGIFLKSRLFHFPLDKNMQLYYNVIRNIITGK